MLELTYIYHDCFFLTTPECAVVFDFWKNRSDDEDSDPEFISSLPSQLPLYVFVSHFHKDHFNKRIFKWAEMHDNIQFIISRDTYRHARYLLCEDSLYAGNRPQKSRVTILQPGEEYSDDIISVHAFGSTDVGNSYAVTLSLSGHKIFHAGDLNCWTWRDESTSQEIEEAEEAFRKELHRIVDSYTYFDIAMFPVDSRIGSGYAQGAREFVGAIEIRRFFPMHFELADTDDELKKRKRDAADFNQYAAPRGEYIALMAHGDSFRTAT